MMEEEESLTLAPMESILAASILHDLQRHLTLIKLSALKSQGGSYLGGVTRGNDKKLEIYKEVEGCGGVAEQLERFKLPEGKEGSEKTVLEAKLEYLKLCKKTCSKEGLRKAEVGGRDSRDAEKDKFFKDVDYIIEVVHKTKESLKETGSFAVLKQEVEKTSEILSRESRLKPDIEAAQQRILEMKQELRKRNEEMFTQEKLKVGEITRLKDELHLTQVEGKEALKLADKYFEAQSCNTNCSHRNEMDERTKEIHQVQRQIDRDVHCLTVMESWTEDFCTQLEHKIDEWKRKFKRDELAMEMRIESKKRAIKNQEELIKSINETIAERQEELAPWEAEKEVERQERLAHMRRYYSARKIQRWWRGYMVKLKLYKRRRLKPKGGN